MSPNVIRNYPFTRRFESDSHGVSLVKPYLGVMTILPWFSDPRLEPVHDMRRRTHQLTFGRGGARTKLPHS